MIVVGADAAVAQWVGERVGKSFSEPYVAIGVKHGPQWSAGFVFNDYTGDSIEVSFAGRVAAARHAMPAVLQYVFDRVGCARMQAHTNRRNKAMRKLMPRLGFKFEGVARNFYGRDDGLVFSLNAKDVPAFRARWKL